MNNLRNNEKLLIVDVLEPASTINSLIGQFLVQPPRGIYLPHTKTSVISEKEVYYFHNERSDEMVGYAGVELIACPEMITSDVYCCDGGLILKSSLLPMTTRFPTVPVAATDMVFDIINRYCVKHFTYNKGGEAIEESVVEDYLQESVKEKAVITKAANFVFEAMELTRFLLTDFMGNDHYRRHVVKKRNYTANITKEEDYRILRFNELLASGEIEPPSSDHCHYQY